MMVPTPDATAMAAMIAMARGSEDSSLITRFHADLSGSHGSVAGLLTAAAAAAGGCWVVRGGAPLLLLLVLAASAGVALLSREGALLVVKLGWRCFVSACASSTSCEVEDYAHVAVLCCCWLSHLGEHDI
jgi:hypothetical protein